jgi:Ca2+-binding EF-hand superfamily protein
MYGTRSPRSRRKVEIQVVHRDEAHPLGGYSESPRALTNTDMRIARREKDKPHPSMDVDGDGTVSQFDFKLAHRFDDDGNGILDEEETANLRAMMAKQNVRDIAKMMGAAKKTDMDFEQIKGQILGEGPSKEQRAMEGKLTGEEIMLMRNAFDALDEDHSGKIDAGELGSLSAELGQPMEAHEVAEVLTEIDADNSGQVDFNEFKAYWAVCKQSAADGAATAGTAPQEVAARVGERVSVYWDGCGPPSFPF